MTATMIQMTIIIFFCKSNTAMSVEFSNYHSLLIDNHGSAQLSTRHNTVYSQIYDTNDQKVLK